MDTATPSRVSPGRSRPRGASVHPTIPELAARAIALDEALRRLTPARDQAPPTLAVTLLRVARALDAEGAALLGLDARAGCLVWLAGAPPGARPLVLRELPALAARLARLEPAWTPGAELAAHAPGLGRLCLLPLPDDPPRVLLLHGLAADPRASRGGLLRLAARLVAEAAARESLAAEITRAEQRFELSQQGSTAAFFEWDVAGQRIWWSPQLRDLLGYAPEDPADRVLWRDLVHPEDVARVEHELTRYLDGEGARFDLVYRCRRKDGTPLWVWGRLTARRDAAGALDRILGTVLDISDKVRVEDALHREHARAETTLQAIGDAVLTCDAAGRVEYLNPAAERLLGCAAAGVQGRALGDCLRLHDAAQARPVAAGLAATTPLHLEEAVLLRGQEPPLSVTATFAPMQDRAGARAGCVLVLRDVSEQRELAQRLAWQAAHDALTGLVNRREFETRLQAALAAPDAWALMYLDLDHFKVLNDTCGHAAGDALLRQLGDLLRGSVPAGATVARLGGDEFGLLVRHADAPERVAECVRAALARLRFHWEGRVFRLGVSIGLVPVTHGQSVADLLAAADLACYAAKDAGRDRVHQGGPGDAESRRRRGELGWVARVQAALDADRFVLWRQEIRALDGGASHHELLLRLADEQGRLIPPDLFLPAAERHGLMGALDRWVVDHALAWLARMPTAGLHAINLSGQTLSDPDTLAWLEAAFARHGVAPAQVCFEVTETAAIAQLDPALRLMQALRARGCRFALDDFGAGMASFAYLRRLPVDYLKIDGSFVRRLGVDALDRELVRAANHLGHLLGMRTVAEYAEDAAVIAALEALGVDYAQGYGVGQPVPLPDWSTTPTRGSGRGLAGS